jgi:ABC-type lipoprotein release transport system permease subunit
MLVSLLIFDVALVAWSLHLMQAAVDRQEFSLMLAGILVAMSAAAMVVVYSLMNGYFCYLDTLTATAVY